MREQYVRELAEQNEDYKVTRVSFIKEVEESVGKGVFVRWLSEIKSEDDLYYAAVDWSIPVAMVKWFLRKGV